MYEVKCEFCEEHVDTQSKVTWHRVEGWERPGKSGGSDIALRRRKGEVFAHDHCIRREQRRVSALQESLIP